VADHLSRMNREDDKEPIEDKMREDHLYCVLDKDTWMINIIRTIRKMPLDHLDKNAQRRVMAESRKYYWMHLIPLGLERMESCEGVYQGKCETWVPMGPHRPGS
jgi:hypothetical protein